MPRVALEPGSELTSFGVEEVVNMPTEEVFTTPHRLRTEGIVRSTVPLAVNGQIVRDLTTASRAAGGRRSTRRAVPTSSGRRCPATRAPRSSARSRS